jgi:hypothetical protein
MKLLVNIKKSNMYKIFCLTIILLISFSSYSQLKEMRNVTVPDTIYHKLVAFLTEKEKFRVTRKDILIAKNSNLKSNDFSDGVYIFQVNSPHTSLYVFFKTSTKIQILHSENIAGYIEEFNYFVKQNSFDDKTLILFMTGLTNFFKNRNENLLNQQRPINH